MTCMHLKMHVVAVGRERANFQCLARALCAGRLEDGCTCFFRAIIFRAITCVDAEARKLVSKRCEIFTPTNPLETLIEVSRTAFSPL